MGNLSINNLFYFGFAGSLVVVLLVVFAVYKIWKEYTTPLDKRANEKNGKFFIFSQYFFVVYFLAYSYFEIFDKMPISKSNFISATFILVFTTIFFIKNRNIYTSWFSRIALSFLVLSLIGTIIRYLFFQ
jgi:hypothetical protein